MKKMNFGFACLMLLALISCSKNDTPIKNCTTVSSIAVTKPAATIGAGETISLQASSRADVSYLWTIPGRNTKSTATAEIENIDFTNEGWWYFSATNTCNEAKKDSFYLDVKVPQGTPPFAPTADYINLTAVNHQSGPVTTIAFRASSIPGDPYNFGASGGYNDLQVLFHPSYYDYNLPEDGVYTTIPFSATNAPKHGEKDFDKVFITMFSYSPTTILYRSVPGQKVYVSRVNGKFRISICDMALVGTSQGTAYSTNMTASATEK